MARRRPASALPWHGWRNLLLAPRPADEIAVSLFAQLAERRGAEVHSATPAAGDEAWLDRAQQFDPIAVLVSAFPSRATLVARPLVREIRARLPKARILVGLWASGGEPQPVAERLADSGSDGVVTTLAQALAALDAMLPATVAATAPGAPVGAPAKQAFHAG